jgi:hypothetical protein
VRELVVLDVLEHLRAGRVTARAQLCRACAADHTSVVVGTSVNLAVLAAGTVVRSSEQHCQGRKRRHVLESRPVVTAC